MTRSAIIQIITLVAAVGLIIGAGFLSGQVQDVRTETGLGPPKNLDAEPPADMVLLTAASGPLRGLAIDFMWYRLEELKNQGKYYEANTLGEYITKLQPRFPQVWSFIAWNMAYNISVKTNTPQERWEWVNKGVNILREKGIPLNPKSVLLYKELSWIFSHKMGQTADDMHWHYRREMAREWQEVLGAPMEGATTEQAIDAFRKIPDSPDTFEELVAKHPGVEKLMENGFKPLGYDRPNERLLRGIGRVLMFTGSRDARDAARIGVAAPGAAALYDADVLKVISEPKTADDLDALLSFLRKRVLVERYHMDPAFMLDIMENKPDDENDEGYGPLDWRHPSAHGVYWAARGVRLARETAHLQKNIDFINTDRQVIHSLQDLRDTGRLVFDPVSGRLDQLPDTRYIRSYELAYSKAINRSGFFEGMPSGTRDSFMAGYENFLNLAVAFEYVYGDIAKAEEYRAKGRKMFKDRHGKILEGAVYDYDKPLNEVAASWWIENGYMGTGRAFIDGMINQAFERGAGMGDIELYNRHMNLAREIYEKIQKQGTADARVEQERMRLLKFDQVVAFSFRSLIVDPRKDVVLRYRIWQNTPVPIRQAVYDQVLPVFRRQFSDSNNQFDVSRVFPEPPDMDAYRKAHPPPAETKDDAGKATIERN